MTKTPKATKKPLVVKTGARAKRQTAPVTKRRSAEARSFAPAVSKTDTMIAMLLRPEGATSKQLEAALGGWEPHSVRGLIGALKRKGTVITSTKEPKLPVVYRIEVGDVL